MTDSPEMTLANFVTFQNTRRTKRPNNILKINVSFDLIAFKVNTNESLDGLVPEGSFTDPAG